MHDGTDTETDNATTRLNQPWGQFSENINIPACGQTNYNLVSSRVDTTATLHYRAYIGQLKEQQ